MARGVELRPSLSKSAIFADLGYKPHAGQREVHESEAPRRVLACGVRWGKTLCAAMEGLAASLQPRDRSMGWVVAPTYDLADRVFREIVLVAASHLRHRIVKLQEHERRLVIRNLGGGLSEIRAKSADNPTSLLGEGLDWVIVDEAARLKPIIWESHLSQRLIDKKGWALLISTPKGKGWYWELFRRGKAGEPGYASWNRPSWENPRLERAAIELERGRVPDRVFLQEYEAQFIEGAGTVFRNVRECATGEFEKPDQKWRYWAGLDLAKVEDYTVLVVITEQCKVVHIDRFNGLDWSVQVARVQATTHRYWQASTLCDVTGVGDPIYETLAKAGCEVKGYPFTKASKAALVNNLVLMLEQKALVLPKPERCPELIDELEAFEYKVTEGGHVKMGAPWGYHDDTVIALALAVWERRPTRPMNRMWMTSALTGERIW
jgi:hypothetical protein